jgi:hypothetical protein
MWHCVGPRRLLEPEAEDTKILQNIRKYDTQHSQTKEQDSSSSSNNLASKWRQMTTITTLEWDTTNLLKIYTYTIQDVANTDVFLWQAQATHLVCRMLSGSLVQPWRKVKQHLKWLLTGRATNMSLTMAVLPSDKPSSQALGRGVRIAS